MIEELTLGFERGLGERQLAAEFALESYVRPQQFFSDEQVFASRTLCGGCETVGWRWIIRFIQSRSFLNGVRLGGLTPFVFQVKRCLAGGR